MVKEEKTIDGFAVRKAEDSKLVTRSKAEKIKQPVAKPAAKKKIAMKTAKAPAKRKTTRKATSSRPSSSAAKNDWKIEDEVAEKPTRDAELEAELFGKREEAHESFLEAPETFSLGDESDERGTSEGRLEEVGDEEVIEMKQEKKSKRELRKAKKAAKAERKALEKARKKENGSKAGKIVRIVLIVILVALIGGGVYLYFWGDALLKKITGGEGTLWGAVTTLTKETYEPLKTDENGRTNILIYGTSGYDMEGTDGDYTHDGAALTDSIMVVSLDQETGDMAMVSLPRDLYARPTCTATGKVNEVYWCATFKYKEPLSAEQEAEGANAVQTKIKEILGVDTQYYMHVNWGALVDVVDALGGIDVTLDENINDYNYTEAVFEAGVEYHLDGEEALALSRARHGTEHGDFTRGNSQQKILVAIKDKVVEKGLGLSEALAMINAVGDNIRSNFDMDAIKTGMHLLETFDLDSMRQLPLVGDTYYMTTATIDGISYVVPIGGAGNYAKLQEYIARMLKSNPAEREGAEIEVLNGTGEAGVAATEKERLEKRGYTITEVGNAPEGDYKYTEDIEIYDTSEGLKPETKKALEDFYGVEMKPMEDLPNDISPIGYDFIIIIGDSSLEIAE